MKNEWKIVEISCWLAVWKVFRNMYWIGYHFIQTFLGKPVVVHLKGIRLFIWNLRTCYLSPEKLVWGQEATVRTVCGTTDWFETEKGVLQAVCCLWGVRKPACCHAAYFTYTLSTSWELPGWMRHTLESRQVGETSTTSGMQMIPL